MTTLVDLRRQIETATDLGSVVSTMKTLAAVSIRQYERAVEALTDYNRTVELGFQIVLRNQPEQLEQTPRRGRTGGIVFGTDQGMCGQFNEAIVSQVVHQQSLDESEAPWAFLVVGSRAAARLADSGLKVDQLFRVPTSATDMTNLILELLPYIHSWQSERDISRMMIFHNRRTSAATYTSRIYDLLPIAPTQLRRWRKKAWESNSLPLLTTERGLMLSRLVRQYLFVSLFRACAESLASENASRIAAMQQAEKNIEEHLEELNGLFHHIRQTAITEELQDVVTGFEALKTEGDGGISSPRSASA